MMDVEAFLDELKSDPAYADQIVYLHEAPVRAARYADALSLSPGLRELLRLIGIQRLYTHQARALGLFESGHDVLVATGTASGKTLCYALPAIEILRNDPQARLLLLFPTKALCQDQFKGFSRLLQAAGLQDRLAGVLDGDTPASLRRRLRDRGSVVFSNPDMLHAAVMPQHARWAEFLGKLRLLVLDELHVYSGMFGSNMAHVLTRFDRLCGHYGSDPRLVACSATIANPSELGRGLADRDFELVTEDGSPRGKRVTVFWNPPRVRSRDWLSRRSANVEAHELMARLVERRVPTITFSKSKMTAEMIYRYVCERLQSRAPNLAARITPYRGGYLPQERREIEKRLFDGELLGVSTTRALELGIDVGSLEASILVGYPGTLASFLQQAGRAGRRDRDAIVFLIGLDTAVNQYVMTNPGYLFERPVEQAVIDPGNPFLATGHLRCAAHELPLEDEESARFSPHAGLILKVLADNRKLRRIDQRWYYSSPEVPHHEISLRNTSGANVVIEDIDTGAVLGEVDRFDSQPILHPDAVYMHHGDTYLVRELDLQRNLARVQRRDVDYFTNPLGGADIHHIDQQLREKPFGSGTAYWGEVTVYCVTAAYEKVHFYELDAISVDPVHLPTLSLDTMALWIVPPETLMERVRLAGLDAHSGLRGVGYATRMLLPLFMTCDTLDFSHTVGSVNSPWNAVFIYERYPHGLGFTEKVYGLLDRILPAVRDRVRECACEEGCPCCVGKPLRQYATWYVDRGEASIPGKAAALMILDGLLQDCGNLDNPDRQTLQDTDDSETGRLEQALRRRLERLREPDRFHAIRPRPEVRTEYPQRESDQSLAEADVARRAKRRRNQDSDLHKRIAKRIGLDGLDPFAAKPRPPRGMKKPGSNLKPTDFPGRPGVSSAKPLVLGDSLAARARKRYKQKAQGKS